MNHRSEQPVFDERSPIYRQIADQIRQDIVTGALGPDEQVMSTNQYAAFHRINPATAAKAFQRLVDEGLLYKRRGIGMFVAPGAPEQLRAERRARFVEDVLVPVVVEAERLGIPIDEVVDALRARAAGRGNGHAGTDRPDTKPGATTP
jgi:DNA-binding transcriptional regulator YhcF (GntR family)